MSSSAARVPVAAGLNALRLLPLLIAGLVAGGCSSAGDSMPEFLAMTGDAPPPEIATGATAPQDDLAKATEYWGKKYMEHPRDLEAALAYAKNLKAMGQKDEALSVLQAASLYNPTDKKLASEYGRLALERDQLSVAQKLLSVADDPTAPDWRVLSARGTVLAKQGHYADAIPYYERALKVSEGNASILNNLALAQAMNGDAAKAEQLLRQAVATDGASAKTRQNLALVLGLQGKYDEATRLASTDLPPQQAAANTSLVRQMVKLEPKAAPPGGVIAAPSVAIAAGEVPGLKPALASAAPSPAVAGWTSEIAPTAAAAPKVAAAEAPASPQTGSGPLFKPSAE